MLKQSDEPADVVFYRLSNGGLYVDPPRFRVNKNTKISVVFGSLIDEDAKITVPGLPSHSVKGHAKKGLDIRSLKPGAYEYEVKVGKYFAFGNSSPIIIIEE